MRGFLAALMTPLTVVALLPLKQKIVACTNRERVKILLYSFYWFSKVHFYHCYVIISVEEWILESIHPKKNPKFRGPILIDSLRSALLPPAMKLGQGNIFTSVCQEFCPQRGVSGQTPPWEQTPPRSRHFPLGRHPPLEQCILGDMGNKRAVRILLECILVWIHFAHAQSLCSFSIVDKDISVWTTGFYIHSSTTSVCKYLTRR